MPQRAPRTRKQRAPRSHENHERQCIGGGQPLGYRHHRRSRRPYAIIEALAEHGRSLARRRLVAVRREADGIDELRAFLAEFDVPGMSTINQFDVRVWAEAIGNPRLRRIYLDARSEALAALTDAVRSMATHHGLAPEALAELILAVIVGCETKRAIQPAADVTMVLDTLLALLATPKPPSGADA